MIVKNQKINCKNKYICEIVLTLTKYNFWIYNVVRFFFYFFRKKTFNLKTFVTRNKTTYNCLCVKINFRKSTSTMFKNWFCDLFTMITKHKRIENCFRFIIQINSFFVVINKIREINRTWSLKSFFKILIFKTIRKILIITYRKSLQKFYFDCIFRNNITKISIFKNNRDENNDAEFKNRKNLSNTLLTCSRFLSMLSAKFNWCN